MIDPIDLAWLAGLLEGEGYFGLRRKGDVVIQVGMTDPDIIERAWRIVGGGKIKERELPSGKVCYTLTVAKQEAAVALMAQLLPHMGKRRAERIRDCLRARSQVAAPRREWTHCKAGHPLSGDNLRIIAEGKYMKRRCLACAKQRQRKHRAKIGVAP